MAQTQRTPTSSPGNMAEEVRKHLWISGGVQGVWFRESVKEEAERIGGLQGWIRNLPDGRVEAVVQGRPEAVDRIVAYCHEGPDRARVKHLEAVLEPVDEELSAFDVVR